MSNQTHRLSKSHEYRCWSAMKQRCINPRRSNYKWYGGAGVTICARWIDSFSDFIADIGPAPSVAHSLDRWPDNAGNYEPGNVRWATQEQQVANANGRRNMLANLTAQQQSSPKSKSHREALRGCQRGIKKAPWTPERRAAFSTMRLAAEARKRGIGQ